MAWYSVRSRRNSDLREEMEQHLDEKTEALMSEGLGRDEARARARREFGNRTLMEERSREVWQWTRLENIWADTKLALRRMRRAPAFTAAATLTIALGIGANTGVFTLMHALLLRSLPIPEPARLTRIALDINSPAGAANDMPLNVFLLHSIQRHARSLSGVFGWSSYNFVLKTDAGLHVYPGAVVSGNAFQVLGIAPAAGRLLLPSDDRQGGGPDGWAAVVSHRFWQQQYHSDPSVVGRRITLSDHSVTIVGVAPQGFEGVIAATHPDFYLPLEYEPVMRGAGSVLRQPGNLWLTTWARLQPGVTFGAAAAEVHSLFRVAADETLPPAVRHTPVIEKSTFALRPGGKGWSSLRPEYSRPLFLLQALVGIVLLVCCVNLAGLSLARASTREHEFAIRGALGAARGRLMQQPLIESLLIAMAGGALAVAVAWGIDCYLLQFLGDRQAAASLSVRPEPATLLVTGACAIGCALLFGTAPAWVLSRTSFEPALRRKAGPSRRGGLASGIFVPVEIALTLVLVVVSGLLGSTVFRLSITHLGFHTENVFFATADFERLPQKGADLVELYRRMLARMGQMPGVQNVSVAENTPLSNIWRTGIFSGISRGAQNRYPMNDVGPGYFAALGTQVVAGRSFAAGDAGTCMLNRSAAAALFPKVLPLGLTVWQSIHSMNTGTSTSRECRVVGVVEDTKDTSLHEAAPPMVYYPFGPQTEQLATMNFVIRARTLAEARTAYHTALHEIAPGSPEAEPVPFSMQFKDSIARERLLSVLSGFFAALTLLLSGIGVYGLMASYVARRTTEIGVRMTLGATRGGVFVLVMRRAAVSLAAGLLLGTGAAWAAARSLKAFLYGTDPGSPAIFAAAVLLLGLTGLLASVVPARRAVSIEPMTALRNE